MIQRHVRLLLIKASCLASLGAHAGGPLILEGPTGNTPVSYSAPVTLNYDQGQLLFSLTNTQADSLIDQAIAQWNNVSTATVQILKGADLATNIDATNYETVLSDTDNSTYTDDINPVIYDQDGGIIDDFFGIGQSDNVAGFASSVFTVGGTEFVEGYAVLNGKPSLGFDGDDIITVVIHEVGHLIGLDHSQLDIDNTESSGLPSPDICLTTANSNYPAMYPFLCRTGLDLHIDDEMAVTALYPAGGIDTQLAQIRGNLQTAAGAPVLGANIWAEETISGDKISIVSDYLMQSNGFFSMYVPPGTYHLRANAVNTEFTAASSVGPYADSISDVSFAGIPAELAAPNIVEYRGTTSMLVDLVVAAGEAANVTFRVDGSGTNTSDAIDDPVDDTLTGASGSGGGNLLYLPMLMLVSLLALRRSRSA